MYVQQQPQQQSWYYCREANGYYPYVQQCPSGWMQVPPQATPPMGPQSTPPAGPQAAPPMGPR
ncbi:MAG TPA: hypothetical protein VED18_01285 [Candidatus Sulfotelmatobacter sp.]|nr:hypothetical protein [Candidatus Sulfotelmatobacter sp.]